MPFHLSAFAVLLAVVSLLPAGCDEETANSTPSPSAAPPSPTEILLPGNAFPTDMVRSADGTLWVAESALSAIAEIAPSGTITQHPLPRADGDTPSPGDLQVSPDGGIWYTTGEQLGRLDPSSGRFTWWDDNPDAVDNGPGPDSEPNSPNGLTVGPDNTTWYLRTSYDDISGRQAPSVGRADAKRGLLSPHVRIVSSVFAATGSITTGPDRAVWLTQSDQLDGINESESGHDGIGRLTINPTAFKDWPLPKDTDPGDIVAGPDQAMWFTERHGIGRISLDGTFSHFPVTGSKYGPDGITVGPEKAIWFTTDNKIGRLTTNGTITLWSIPGAKRLLSIVPAPKSVSYVVDLASFL